MNQIWLHTNYYPLLDEIKHLQYKKSFSQLVILNENNCYT